MTILVANYSMMRETIEAFAVRLSAIEARKHAASGYTSAPDVWHVKERKKYFALDVGSSGAFLIEKDTGEIFNIKAYGVADTNKKAKANLGNIISADPEKVHACRYNYLR